MEVTSGTKWAPWTSISTIIRAMKKTRTKQHGAEHFKSIVKRNVFIQYLFCMIMVNPSEIGCHHSLSYTAPSSDTYLPTAMVQVKWPTDHPHLTSTITLF